MRFYCALALIVFSSFSIFGSERIDFSEFSFISGYDKYVMVLTSTNHIRLYEKDWDMQWEVDGSEYQVDSIQIAFDQIFFQDKANRLKSMYVQDKVSSFQGKPFYCDTFYLNPPLLFTMRNKTLGSYELMGRTKYWTKKLTCKTVKPFSGGQLVGCLTGNTLYVYDSISGKRVYKKELSAGTWEFETSWNRGVVLSKDAKKAFVLTLPDFSFKPLELDFTQIVNWTRQKEAIIHNAETNIATCLDIESNQSRWIDYFDEPITVLNSENNKILLKLSSGNYKILDDFTGEDIFSFTEDSTDFNPYYFYAYKGDWYFYNTSYILKVNE